jgi:DNA-binding beta-propeller fold protein YncE
VTNFTAGGFDLPSSIAIDGSGNVWVANGGSSTVSGLSSTGSVIAATPFSGAGISTPTGIAISAQ